MIYLDSSALLKLVFEERESEPLERWLRGHGGEPYLTSQLARVEVLRACRRTDLDSVPAARALLSELDLVPLDEGVLAAASEVADPLLRSLDALHLASAMALGPALEAFVAYDHRLSAAARTAGLDVVRPGA